MTNLFKLSLICLFTKGIAWLYSGYVAGKQMTLPEGVTRKDNKTYEEVSIPVSEPPPLNVGSKLVSIASLDEVRISSVLIFPLFRPFLQHLLMLVGLLKNQVLNKKRKKNVADLSLKLSSLQKMSLFHGNSVSWKFHHATAFGKSKIPKRFFHAEKIEKIISSY